MRSGSWRQRDAVLKDATERDVRGNVHLTTKQIRTSCRAHAVSAEGGEGASDALLGAMCRRLSSLPDVRWAKVAEVRSRLLVAGPPSAEVLADMLVDELRTAPTG